MLSEETRGKADRTLKAVEDTKVFDKIEGRIADNNGSLFSLCQRLDKVANRIIGSQPQDGEENCKSAAPPSNIVDVFNERIDHYSANLQGLSNIIQRLERL